MVPERIESLLSIKKGYLVIIFLIAIDLVAKFIAEEYLSFGQAVPLIPILDLLLVFNSGIAFSILDFNNSFLSFGLSIIGILIVIYLHSLYKNEESLINRFSLILIISGASPRGISMMMKCARVNAWMNDRTSLIPEDIHSIFHETIAHRLVFNPVYELRRTEIARELTDQILNKVAAP